MPDKKPKPDLEIYFAARGVYPETVPVRSLAEALAAIHRLATKDQAEADPAALPLRLVDVKRGSAIFRCVTTKPKEYVQTLRVAGQRLAGCGSEDELGYAIHPIRKLSQIAAALDCAIVVRNPDNRSDVIAQIDSSTYGTLAGSLLVKGEKSLTGNVQRVGGATDTRCALRVSFQSKLLYCRVSDPRVVRELARYLYENVVVSGRAQWLKRTWELTWFEIREVHRPQVGQLEEAIAALRVAGADAWDHVDDPARFLEGMTGAR